MSKFSVYYNPEDLEPLYSLSPYNLKRDIKTIDRTELDRIAEEIGNEVRNGINRPPATTALYWAINRKAAYEKIRVLDVARDAGKSNGYRCIVLVDYVNNAVFLLHLYRHGHGESDNISRKDQNTLRSLVDEYVASLEAQKQIK